MFMFKYMSETAKLASGSRVSAASTQTVRVFEMVLIIFWNCKEEFRALI